MRPRVDLQFPEIGGATGAPACLSGYAPLNQSGGAFHADYEDVRQDQQRSGQSNESRLEAPTLILTASATSKGLATYDTGETSSRGAARSKLALTTVTGYPPP